MIRRSSVFVSYGFVAALLLLLLNDLVLKHTFHNFLTGKLSDFTGLFVFSVFLCVLFPGNKKTMLTLAGAAFILWKSPLAQPLIDGWNSLNIFGITRTIDYSDYMALPVLVLAFNYKGTRMIPLSILRLPVLLLTLFAFCATSYDRTLQINKTYTLNLAKEELIDRINSIDNGCRNMVYSFNIANADTMLVNWKDTSWISFTSYTIRKDTMYRFNPVTKKPTTVIDTIYQYFIPETDTTFLKEGKPFSLTFHTQGTTRSDTSSYCSCVVAQVSISGTGNVSYLTLKSIFINYCMDASGKRARKKLIMELTRAFEKEYIERISQPPDESGSIIK